MEDLLALDATFAGSAAATGSAVQHCNGDFCSVEGYSWDTTALGEGEPLRLAPRGGRPCDGAFPYVRVLLGGAGLSLAVGWPGQWSATFAVEATGVAIRAGQETDPASAAAGRDRPDAADHRAGLGGDPRASREPLATLVPRARAAPPGRRAGAPVAVGRGDRRG